MIILVIIQVTVTIKGNRYNKRKLLLAQKLPGFGVSHQCFPSLRQENNCPVPPIKTRN